jgi:hypothetical protein
MFADCNHLLALTATIAYSLERGSGENEKKSSTRWYPEDLDGPGQGSGVLVMEKFYDEIVIGGQPVKMELTEVPIDKIELDHDNPRIRYRLQLQQDGKELEDVILAMPEVRKLRADIEKNGGLRERPILQMNGNGTYKALEGNCRVVCVESLNKKKPSDPRWKKVPARIIPKDVDPKSVAILLSDMHIAGKIQWKAHEKAGQVYHMHHTLGMRIEDIAIYLRASKSTVQRLLDAYRLMVEKFLTIDEGKFAGKGEGKWSFFDELYRSKELRDELKKNPEFSDDFCRWVGSERLPDGADVRKLPGILKHPDARKKFEKGAPLPEVTKMVEAAEPEQGSDFFKMLAKMRDELTNAAQVKEILRIRTDKVARERLVETYEALVDFMLLADVEPPAPHDKPKAAA